MIEDKGKTVVTGWTLRIERTSLQTLSFLHLDFLRPPRAQWLRLFREVPPTALRKALLSLLTYLIASVPLVLAQGTYTQIDYPGGLGTGLYGINSLGDVIGWWFDGNRLHGFLLSGGVFTTLACPNHDTLCLPYGINDNGQIVGLSQSGAGAFLYDSKSDVYTTFSYPNVDTFPYGINNAGIIVGTLEGHSSQVGFELDGTTYATVKVKGARTTTITSINNLGDAVVASDFSNGDLKYFVLNSSGLTRLNDGPGIRQPYGINDDGDIVGSFTSQHLVAWGFLSDGTHLKFPGATRTSAYAVNNAGVVVGGFFTSPDSHGFIWAPPADPVKK